MSLEPIDVDADPPEGIVEAIEHDIGQAPAEQAVRTALDPAAFAREHFAFDPYPYQRDVLDAVVLQGKQRLAWIAGRRVGKSEGIAQLVLQLAVRRPGLEVVVFAPSQSQATVVSRKVRYHLAGSKWEDKTPTDNVGELTIRHGTDADGKPVDSRILCMTLSGKVRGEGADVLVIDESAFCESEDYRNKALPFVVDRPDSVIVHISTVWAEDDHFMQAYRRYDELEHGATFHTPTTEKPGVTEAMLEEFKDQHIEFTNTALAARFLIEFLAAQPPSGDEPVSLAVYDDLLALCSLITDLGFESDLLDLGITDHELRVLPSGRIGRPETPHEDAVTAFGDLFIPHKIEEAAATFPDHWAEPEEQGEPPEYVQRFDEAAREEFGLSIDEQVTFLTEAINLAHEQDQEPARMSEETFLERVAGNTDLPRDDVERGLELFSLEPRQDFLSPPDPFEQREVYPWIFNRKLSFIRRPLIIQEGDAREILWGQRHTWVALENLVGLCATGRLRAESDELTALIGERNHETGKRYNRQIGDIIEQTCEVAPKVNWDAGGSMVVDGEPLGDVDVLVPDIGTQTLFVVECKRLSQARTPRELDNELRTLFGHPADDKDDDSESRSTIEKHQRRCSWVEEHEEEVLGALGLDADESFSVQPVLLLDKPLISPFFADPPIPIVLRGQLEQHPLVALRRAQRDPKS